MRGWRSRLFLAVFLASITPTARSILRARCMETGLGYANTGWHNSETVPTSAQHPELGKLVSTGEMGIYFWTGRMPKVLASFPEPAGA